MAQRVWSGHHLCRAHLWFHDIFDPTHVPSSGVNEPWPERVWQIKPFFEHGVGKSIERAMLLLKSSGLSNTELAERKSSARSDRGLAQDPIQPAPSLRGCGTKPT